MLPNAARWLLMRSRARTWRHHPRHSPNAQWTSGEGDNRGAKGRRACPVRSNLNNNHALQPRVQLDQNIAFTVNMTPTFRLADSLIGRSFIYLFISRKTLHNTRRKPSSWIATNFSNILLHEAESGIGRKSVRLHSEVYKW